eukprot:s298_g4.t1
MPEVRTCTKGHCLLEGEPVLLVVIWSLNVSCCYVPWFWNLSMPLAAQQDYFDSGVSSTNAVLAACEDLDWSEFEDLCEERLELGPASWVQAFFIFA